MTRATPNPAVSRALLPDDRNDIFTDLVASHHAGMLAVARSIVGDNDAEEAVQDAWVAAYGALETFEGRSSIRTWLVRIVINEARMRLRKRGRELTFDPGTLEPDALDDRFRPGGSWKSPPRTWGFHSPEELLQEQDLLACIEKTLDSLPSHQRLVMELRDLQGLDFDDICNMLEISSSNARVMLHRARAKLFTMIEHYQETGEC